MARKQISQRTSYSVIGTIMFIAVALSVLSLILNHH